MYIYELTRKGKLIVVVLSLSLLLIIASIFNSLIGNLSPDDVKTSPDVSQQPTENNIITDVSPDVSQKPIASEPTETSPNVEVSVGSETSPNPSESLNPDVSANPDNSIKPIFVDTATPEPTPPPAKPGTNWGQKTLKIDFVEQGESPINTDATVATLKEFLSEKPDFSDWYLVVEGNVSDDVSETIALKRAKNIVELLTIEVGINSNDILPISSKSSASLNSVKLYFVKNGSK